MKNLFLYTAVTLLLVASCSSPRRLYKRGRMEAAVKKAIKNLRKRKVRDKDVIVLEKAFAIVNNRDYNQLQVLLDDDDKKKWDRVNSISKTIYNRQQALKPYLPLYIKKENREASFKFYPVKEMMQQSKKKAAEQYYNEGMHEMELAQKGDRRAARRAHANFDATKRYYNSYKDVSNLMNEAHKLGTTYAIIGMSNETNALLPARFKNEVLRMYPSDMNTFWTKFDLNPKSRKYDYKVIIRLTNVAGTPEQIRNDHFIEEKEVEDGFDYALDANGNVQKDTSGNDIKIMRYATIRADVFTSEQFKATTLTAFVDVINTKTNDRLMSRQVSAEAIFSNKAMRFEGNRDALTSQTRRMLGNRPTPFPSDEEMLIRAAASLAPRIKDMICDNVSLLEN